MDITLIKMKNYQTVSIQFTKSDAEKLIQKAKQNRLKLSSYLRQLLTKDLILTSQTVILTKCERYFT